METMDVKRAGLAGGITGGAISVICLLLVLVLPSSGMVYLANSLLHSIDVSSLASAGTGLLQSLVGIVAAFIIGWAIAALFAFVYNRTGG